MAGWHHRLNAHVFEQTPGVGDGQGGLACCSPWGHKQSDMPVWAELNIWPSNSTSEYTAKRTETGTWTGVCIAVFTAVLSTTDRRSKKLNCPSVDEQISKTWSIHTMEYDSALKKKGYPVTCYNTGEPWGHQAKWNMSVTKDKHYIIPLMKIWKKSKFTESENRIVVTRGWGREKIRVVV